MITREISHGIDPVPVYYDLAASEYRVRLGGRELSWPLSELPFTLTPDYCVDRAIVEKYLG